jgi:Arc/MetJ-type ribon-helix-helix transcriptional regulator
MTIRIKPETEQLVKEELQSGHFRSVDEIIVEGVQARRQKEQTPVPAAEHQQPKKNLVELFAESPFKGLAMNFERFPDILPPVDL